MNVKNTLTREDFEQWAHEALIYCILPTVLIFLITLQTGNFQEALGASYATLLAAAINLINKFKAGIDPKDFPTGTTSIVESTPTELVKTTKSSNETIETLPKDKIGDTTSTVIKEDKITPPEEVKNP